MNRSLTIFACLLVSVFLLAGCNSDTSLPTLRPTLDPGESDPTVDPDLGSGFDPDLGNDDATVETPPTPTRESGSTGDTDIESGARGTGFMAQITGSTIDEIVDGGQYACNLTGHRIASGDSPAPNITFTLPSTVTAGTFTFTTADGGNGQVSVLVSLASVDDSYNQVTGGTLTIDRLPEEDGDFVSGNFDFTVTNETGTEVGIRGDFDFETTDTVYCS